MLTLTYLAVIVLFTKSQQMTAHSSYTAIHVCDTPASDCSPQPSVDSPYSSLVLIAECSPLNCMYSLTIRSPYLYSCPFIFVFHCYPVPCLFPYPPDFSVPPLSSTILPFPGCVFPLPYRILPCFVLTASLLPLRPYRYLLNAGSALPICLDAASLAAALPPDLRQRLTTSIKN